MSSIHDLRSYLNILDENGRLERIEKPVSIKHELANVATAVLRQRHNAVFFNNIHDSPWQIFTGAVAMPELASLALDCSVNDITEVMESALQTANGILPEKKIDAVWKENILIGDDVDIKKIPVPTHGKHDGGAFITGGVSISKDPISGRGNLSYNRMQVLGHNTLGFNINEWRHIMTFYKLQEAKNEPLHIAIAIGLDPAIMIAAGARYDDDELLIAGAIRRKGVPVCKGVTVDIDIPSEAEIVLEGYLPPFERKNEGPLAEFHGYYGEEWHSPVLHLTAICFRHQPIYQTIIPGASEHIYIGNVLPREPLLLNYVRHVSKNVTGLHIPPYGNGFSAIIQIQKCNPGEPVNTALAAFTAHINIKQVIVVDPDINIYDPTDILWALNNRVDWSKDILLIPGAQGHEMDPTADNRGIHTKICIDATIKPERRRYGKRVYYTGIDLQQYL